MRSIGLSFLVLAMLSVASGAEPVPAPKKGHHADEWPSGTYMRQALDLVATASLEAANGSKIGLAKDVSVLGALLKKRGKASIVRTLEAGTRYLVVAGGDEFVRDVDLRLKDPAGTVVKKDEDVDDSAFVSYTPTETGRYTLTVELYDAPEDCLVAMAIFSENGWTVKADNLRAAAAKLMLSGSVVADKISKDTGFIGAEGQWALFGSVLKANDSMTISNVRLEGKPYAFIGACDGQSDDIDLFLKKDGTTVGKDEDDDDNPLILTTSPSGMHALEMRNSGDRTSLVLMAGLEIGDKSGSERRRR